MSDYEGECRHKQIVRNEDGYFCCNPSCRLEFQPKIPQQKEKDQEVERRRNLDGVNCPVWCSFQNPHWHRDYEVIIPKNGMHIRKHNKCWIVTSANGDLIACNVHFFGIHFGERKSNGIV